MSGSVSNFPGVGPLGNTFGAGRLHGDYWAGAMNSTTYWVTTALAGTVSPAYASGLAGTFILANPANSGKTLELLVYSLGLLNATTVVSDISLYFQTAGAALSSTTALTVQPAILSSGANSVANAYSAGTFTGALVKGPTMVSFGAVTAGTASTTEFNFNGRILVPAGTTVTIAGKVAQAQAMQHGFLWNEQ